MLGVSLGASPQVLLSIIDRKTSNLKKGEYSTDILRDKKNLLNLISQKIISSNLSPVTASGIDQNEIYLDLEDSLAVAGLVFLLESGGAEECLHLYNSLIQAKDFYRTNERTKDDLEILCDEASLTYSAELKQKRFYESAANVLEKRLSSCGKRKNNPFKNNQITMEIDSLLPYRILDLLSRSNDNERMKGLEYLRVLLEERGGIDSNSDEGMRKEEFAEFFRQIRQHLTVQEQIEFFKSERERSGEIAQFLECTALVACGFSQRKPQRIAEALNLLKELNHDELRPIEANLYLLLGDVQRSSSLINQYANDDLKKWLQLQTKDDLAGLCYWCQEWLERDVLSGYRDVDVDPDLDAYFCDKDVISYLDPYHNSQSYITDKSVKDQGISYEKTLSVNNNNNLSSIRQDAHKQNTRRVTIPHKVFWNTLLIATLITISLALMTRIVSYKTTKSRDVKIQSPVNSIQSKSPQTVKEFDLNSVIRRSIADWQNLKKDALSELSVSKDYKKIASEKAIKNLYSEVSQLRVNSQRKMIDVSIIDLQIDKESDSKVIATATLKYNEILLSRNGDPITKTPSQIFKRRYVLVRSLDGDWVVDS